MKPTTLTHQRSITDSATSRVANLRMQIGPNPAASHNATSTAQLNASVTTPLNLNPVSPSKENPASPSKETAKEKNR